MCYNKSMPMLSKSNFKTKSKCVKVLSPTSCSKTQTETYAQRNN